MLAIALAGTASAAKWKDLRVDGSSEDAFAQSLAEFKEQLSPARRYAFGEALKDIWVQRVKAAEAEQRKYTAAEYYRQLDGLGYEQVVTFTDPTGDTAKRRLRDGMRRVATVGGRGGSRAPTGAAPGGRLDRGPEYSGVMTPMGSSD
jgi:hypothetical protein